MAVSISETRALTDEQLHEELAKSYQDMMNLRFRAATNQLPNTNLPRLLRRSIARLKTVMRERQLVEG
ncbi:MAG: 50S ribosomal protein L29 [Chloroflexi bacterium]|nr:50S ribosomal protein L29 [Chloroflexota bacterium]